MKIGIITLPLNDNFGGILQAFALREYLTKEGHEVIHIEKESVTSLVHWSSSQFNSWWYARRPLGQLLNLNRTRSHNHDKYDFRKRTKQVRAFVEKYIPRRIVKNLGSLEGEFDCFVVGSDQVWRPHYNPEIEYSFLNFAAEWKVKKIAYAPSFGVSHWEFNETQTNQFAYLLENFDAVSVREDQGVVLCKENFGIKATRLVDPTMLLDRAVYQRLIGQNVATRSKQLTTYILDMTPEKRAIIRELQTNNSMNSSELGLAEHAGGTDATEKADISIEDWLREFMRAEFIFTDSFHGCLFAILFHKPFIVFGNKDRGLSRFNTVLKLFKLEDRMVFDTDQIKELYNKEIDWVVIDKILEEERAKSNDFFREVDLQANLETETAGLKGE